MSLKTLVYKLKIFLAVLGMTAIIAGPVSAEQEQVNQADADKTLEIKPVEDDLSQLSSVSAAKEFVKIGSTYKDTGYKFEVELVSTGAAISTAALSEFQSRDPDNPVPLVLLSPIDHEGKTIYSLVSGAFRLADNDAASFDKKAFPLNLLNWKLVESSGDKAVFDALLTDASGAEAARLTKTYSIKPDSYDVVCELRIENLTNRKVKASIDMQGPAGMTREAVRNDMRNLAAAFITEKGIKVIKHNNNQMRKAVKTSDTERLQVKHKDAAAKFIWAAMTNKYFAAILRPVPQVGEYPLETSLGKGQYYDPDILQKKPGGKENSSFSINTLAAELAPASEQGSSKTFRYELYLGPKSKEIFSKNETYRKLSYFQTIDFRTCCCPQSMIAPLAFGIMGLMKLIYGIIPNYGVAIIILVFLVRLAMHPVTKKSQVSMMKMQKLGPKIQEIQKKYANNKAEMNKQVMAMYREQGVSPFMSFLPMMIQMPIWIALWTAIYASVDLRGAAFLPFWITDLSAPDALISFKAITIPLLDWQIDSFNLLPILMGVVMYLQQKMMPQSAQAQTNPQMAQQQKMMMIMMPLMFPIMLYKGPSGVNLYIMTSIGAGVIEQAVIRKHIREKEQAESQTLVSVTSKTGGKVKKKKPKPFFRDH